MRYRGWLLDPYIEDRYAVLWVKTVDGEAHRLRDRYTPSFYVEPREGFKAEEVAYLFEENPDVHSTRVAERYASLRRRRLKEVVLVRVDSIRELRRTVNYAKGLREVKEVYNIGLTDIQWYLINKDVAPSDYVEWTENQGMLKEITVLDDGMTIEPPPFDVLIFHTPESEFLRKVEVYDGERRSIGAYEGCEVEVLTEFQDLILERDPDIIVTEDVAKTTKDIIRRARELQVDFAFGRWGETYRGRILLELRRFMEIGVAGLVERSRFTFAPMGATVDWEAGKSIDSRQCYEANRLGVLVPEMRGGYGYDTTAWDLVARDRGGLIFSPQVGLHENVGALDFESMFPNIIVRRNVSYETVGPEGVDTETPGFMGGFTRRFLDRRLHFKHLRNRYPEESREWLWCEQRQLALKLILVCIYGYSGCYANRFANVRVFQEINRIARRALVQSLNIALERGFEVIYGHSDSLFTKKPNAAREDYEELAAILAEATGLPIRLDRHFKFLVLLPKTSDPQMEAANHYYGKLTDGSLFCRGIELRRHDTPPYIKRLQERMMETLFDAEDAETVLRTQLPRVLRIVGEACRRISSRDVESEDLIVSKRLRKELSEYKSLQPHIVAAHLGAEEGGLAKFIFVNVKRKNPYLRVMPAFMLKEGHRSYDRERYVTLVRRAADHLLRPLLPDDHIGGMELRESRLNTYF